MNDILEMSWFVHIFLSKLFDGMQIQKPNTIFFPKILWQITNLKNSQT